eukprot:CAMPEP_0119396958 /NCGR_PEP_ID=MMETSP1334-20130426/139047_1 /TAXON_ID=127549 /ORGANISM="Calcidiscus leptoporus, Strain RCC1130" /LENGTH=55 /DNA_ID=CAMNT_0007420727 /DNA_START=16 /DNA_END=180 /DNA_ORIENTATION=-
MKVPGSCLEKSRVSASEMMSRFTISAPEKSTRKTLGAPAHGGAMETSALIFEVVS